VFSFGLIGLAELHRVLREALYTTTKEKEFIVLISSCLEPEESIHGQFLARFGTKYSTVDTFPPRVPIGNRGSPEIWHRQYTIFTQITPRRLQMSLKVPRLVMRLAVLAGDCGVFCGLDKLSCTLKPVPHRVNTR
jgi:hypothetical protein